MPHTQAGAKAACHPARPGFGQEMAMYTSRKCREKTLSSRRFLVRGGCVFYCGYLPTLLFARFKEGLGCRGGEPRKLLFLTKNKTEK